MSNGFWKERAEMAKPAPHPGHSPISLSSLPDELLPLIASYLPLQSAISFALVARRYTLPAERGIWRNLPLYLPARYGEAPLIPPFARGDARNYAWTQMEAWKAEQRRMTGLRAMVRDILMWSTPRRLGMVEKVVVVPLSGAISGIITLIDMVADHLLELEIGAPPSHTICVGRQPFSRDTLDMAWLTTPMSFPSLTHLTIGNRSLYIAEFLLLLVKTCPALISLDADLRDGLKVSNRDDIKSYSITISSPTDIRYLRLAFSDRFRDLNDDRHPVSEIIEHSPHLRQVSLLAETADSSWMLVMEELAIKQELVDLQVSACPQTFCENTSGLEGQFPVLRRLVLGDGYGLDFFDHMPPLPALEIIYIHQDADILPLLPDPASPSEPPPSLIMMPSLETSLSESPHLRSIHFLRPLPTPYPMRSFYELDEIEKAGGLLGTVTSLHHGEEKVIHARFLSRHYEMCDVTRPDCDVLPKVLRVDYDAEECHINYDGDKQVQRTKFYGLCPELEGKWLEYADHEGLAVPLEVFEQMRQAAGATEAEWQGRGVEVGEKAWAVLTAWREQRVAGLTHWVSRTEQARRDQLSRDTLEERRELLGESIKGYRDGRLADAE